MGRRVSFVRVDMDILNLYSHNRELLIENVFNPTADTTLEVVNIDKSFEGILYLLTGKQVGDAEVGLVNNWKFRRFIRDSENGNIYYQEPGQVEELNKALSSIAIDRIVTNFDAKKFIDNEIYPEVWDQEQGYDGFKYLKTHLEILQRFYSDAAVNKEAVISIPT